MEGRTLFLLEEICTELRHMNTRLDSMNARMDAISYRMDREFGGIRDHLCRLDERIDGFVTRVERLEAK
jgi:archaellum component FlaC